MKYSIGMFCGISVEEAQALFIANSINGTVGWLDTLPGDRQWDITVDEADGKRALVVLKKAGVYQCSPLFHNKMLGTTAIEKVVGVRSPLWPKDEERVTEGSPYEVTLQVLGMLEGDLADLHFQPDSEEAYLEKVTPILNRIQNVLKADVTTGQLNCALVRLVKEIIANH